ncbi:hypothetical protein DFH09DRAFT_1142299 [Mycena vulgaris]|nr:hypothetical protein DFH09DRAFT_1142299 [Mycena vulgaris]
MLPRLCRARAPALARCLRTQSARLPSGAASKYALAVGSLTALALATVWTSQPVLVLDSPRSRDFDSPHLTLPPRPDPNLREHVLRDLHLKNPGAGGLNPSALPAEKSQPEPAPSPAPSEPGPAQGVVQSDEGAVQEEKDAARADGEADTGGDSGGGAFNPETGEINWDCSCLGGMAHGPCGPEFREAFSCFVHSEDEPKGINCVEKFQGMQTCFREHPEVYASEIADDEEAEAAEREGALPAEGEDAKDSASRTDTSRAEPEPASPSTPAPKPSEEAASSQQ